MHHGLSSGLETLGAGLVGTGVLGTILTMLGDWAVLCWLRERGRGKPDAALQPRDVSLGEIELPPISVLRPVKGLDVGLRENFEALLAQSYPRFEVLVGAENSDDPALEVARQVAQDSPVPVRVLVCPQQTGLNPKVSILEALAKEARYDAVLISDSNVRVRPGYLANLGSRLNLPGVGLVTNIVLGEAPGTCAALMEALQLTTFVARATMFARHFLSHSCVVGKSMLFRLSDWSALGGFPRVRNVLAEDYVMGQTYANAGFQVALSPDPAPVPLPHWSWSQLMNRHVRWAQMRRRVSLSAYLLEPLLYPTPFLALGMLLCVPSGAQVAMWLALAAACVRTMSDLWLIGALNDGRARFWWVFAAPAKDLLALVVWGVGGFKRSLTWRGSRLVIGAGSRLEREVHAQALTAESA